MEQNNKWLISIKNPKSNNKYTIYEDGRVYGNERNELLFILTEKAIRDIKTIINANMKILRHNPCLVEDVNGLIIKINYKSRTKENIRIVGWRFSEVISNIILNPSNMIKI